jgi:hypothetical protein
MRRAKMENKGVSMKVRIVKCSDPKSWYALKIGKIFDVKDGVDYYDTSYEIGNAIGVIEKYDCEVILNIIELFEYLKEHPGARAKHTFNDSVVYAVLKDGQDELFYDMEEDNESPFYMSEKFLTGWTVEADEN